MVDDASFFYNMNVNGIKNQLVFFLRENGALAEFMTAFEEERKFASIMELCDSVPPRDIFKHCFTWNKTKNGDKFWVRLHRLWSNGSMRYCDKPDNWMMVYPVGQSFIVEGFGQLEVVESEKSLCHGCVFLKERCCFNKGMYACTPYSRGDGKQVIFVKND